MGSAPWATWTGDTMEQPPVALDASIIFAPAGEIVPAALSHLEGGDEELDLDALEGAAEEEPAPSEPN